MSIITCEQKSNGQYEVKGGNFTLTQTVLKGDKFNDVTEYFPETETYVIRPSSDSMFAAMFIALHQFKTNAKYKVGDKVNYTNDYGVNWGTHTIIGVTEISYSNSGYGYYLDPSDTPWYATKEECLTAI